MDGGLRGSEIVAVQKATANVERLLIAEDDDFQTEDREWFSLTFDGLVGDLHSGITRKSGGREPWYPRRTEIRNARQLTIVCPDELAYTASLMGVERVEPEWIGANLVLSGVKALSMLPAGSVLFFPSGATLKVEMQNHPCKIAGRVIAEQLELGNLDEASLLFPKHGRRLRGLTATVERPGPIARGDAVSIRVPEQWIYRA